MKHRSWESSRLETMRARFEKSGIAVGESRPEHSGGAIEIVPDLSTLACLVMVYGPGAVWYIFRLRLLSDDANRVISDFIIETATDIVHILEPKERVPSKYVSWDPDAEDILNDHVGQPFGPTRVREGLLLGRSFKSPAVDRRHRWASLNVVVVDQFENCNENAFPVRVCDDTSDAQWAASMRPERRGTGLFEPDEDATPEERRQAAAFAESLATEQRRSDAAQPGKRPLARQTAAAETWVSRRRGEDKRVN